MAISKFWENIKAFSASEAAYLVLGIEPEDKPEETLASHRYLMREMHKSFLDTCGHLRFCIERDRHPDETITWLWTWDHEEIIFLASTEMVTLLEQVEAARSYLKLEQYRHLTLNWLENGIDHFHSQRFSRENLSSWLYWQSINSEFNFEAVNVQTPEMRREHVRNMVQECGGNKSEAARRLGISRTRVDQLISDQKESSSNPLHPQAQDPFGIARSQGHKR